MNRFIIMSLVFLTFSIFSCNNTTEKLPELNDSGYFEAKGINVMAFSDFYPEGHQGGITIILNGNRIAANGDLRLEPTPGQWQPIPRLKNREVDSINKTITAYLVYPDSARDGKGFNPIIYPQGLYFNYSVTLSLEGKDFKVTVDLDEPLPEEWIGKIGFNLELFPGEYFGKHFQMDDETGIFPRQLNGPMYNDTQGNPQVYPMAEGHSLFVSPENPESRISIKSENNLLQLYDGRAQHNNGWFVVHSPVPANASKGAIEWLISADANEDFLSLPVVHTSQVGYHPVQEKVAVIELDKYDTENGKASLLKINPEGNPSVVKTLTPDEWGKFLRYRYLKFDFTDVTESGIYRVEFRDQQSPVFEIRNDIFDKHVWQPVLEYFLPVQMCHMRVNDRYRVWHGLCHMDDATMAPVNHNHFDGYEQGSSTLTKFSPGDPVPGLNTGGWHDAGDYDIRVESQIGTVKILSNAYLQFGVDYDATMISQNDNITELHQPDGIPDILQQIEHGVLSILGGYKSLGRLYRGIISNDLRQYVLLGDGSTMTDNQVNSDDRWVFTEDNPSRELNTAAGLATASLALRDYNPQLADDCYKIAQILYSNNSDKESQRRLNSAKAIAVIELFHARKEEHYKKSLIDMRDVISENFRNTGPALAKVISLIDDHDFLDSIKTAAADYRMEVDELEKENPFGVPYRPNIWGAGWDIQAFGVSQYFLNLGWPEIFDTNYMLHSLNFVLGCHPGDNSLSFASGVGSESLEVAYGTNRADWSYIPGGVGSGTALIRPDFPELKKWPYFWQQTEYVMGGGSSNFMFLALAANHVLNK